MINNRKCRECALQIMYEIDILLQDKDLSNQKKNKTLIINKIIINEKIENMFINFKIPKILFNQSSLLVKGTLNNIKQIDNTIQKHSIKWRLERLLKIDRNILRLASYELFFSHNLSVGIILNEAIEIAKKFSNNQSSKFINGILNSISKDARKNSVL